MYVNELGLTEDDRRILVSREWYIYAAQSLLKQCYPLQNGLCNTSYLKEQFDWPSIPHNFVQIIHVGNSRWACISNKLCKKDENHVVELFDSMHTEPGSTIKQQICTIPHCEKPFLTIRVIHVQRQKLGDSCGLYAIAMALDICVKEKIHF